MDWSPHTTVAAVVERDGRFLMVEERIRDGRLAINQPAGHLDEGETLIDAAIRETREESGWRFTPHGLVGVYRWQVPPDGVTYLRFCFHGTVDDHRPEHPLDPVIVAVHWMSREQLQQAAARLRSPLVMRCVDDYLAGSRHPLTLLRDLG